MIDLRELIQNRRTIHHFEPTPVAEGVIQKALELAVYAPNHHHTHPCRFYLIGPDHKATFLEYAERSFADRDPQTAEKKLNRWRGIPGWVLVTRKKNDNEKTSHEDYATLSIALYIMMQYLTAEGIGSKWSTGSLLFEAEVYEIFGIDASQEMIEGLFWYGYPEKTPLPFPKPEYAHYVKELS